MTPPFTGSKVALFLGGRLVVKLRDDKPGLPWAAMWDMPGGGREGEEDPWACSVRETREEVGIDLSGDRPVWAGRFPSSSQPGGVAWFHVVSLPAGRAGGLRLGDEGQELALWTATDFLAHPRAIGFLKDRLRAALAELPDLSLQNPGL